MERFEKIFEALGGLEVLWCLMLPLQGSNIRCTKMFSCQNGEKERDHSKVATLKDFVSVLSLTL